MRLKRRVFLISTAFILLGVDSVYYLHLLFKSNWEGFFATIGALATAGGLLYVLFKETLLARLRQPTFKHKVLMEPPYVTQEGKDEGSMYWYHIGITNVSGRTTAKGCMCYIDEIYLYNNEKNNYEKIKNFIPMPLPWARETDTDERTFIQPHQQKFVDFVRVEPAETAFGGVNAITKLCFRRYSDFAYLAAGLYKIKIIIYCENGESLQDFLYVRWSGNHSPNYNSMLEELIISSDESAILNYSAKS